MFNENMYCYLFNLNIESVQETWLLPPRDQRFSVTKRCSITANGSHLTAIPSLGHRVVWFFYPERTLAFLIMFLISLSLITVLRI